MIKAQRFESLGTDTNIPIADLFSLGEGSGTLNAIVDDLKDLTVDMENFLKLNVQDPDSIFEKAKAETLDYMRKAKGVLGELNDITAMTPGMIDEAISDLFPDNSAAKAAFSTITQRCRNKAMSNGGYGKPYDFNIKCGGRDKKSNSNQCYNSSFNNVLNSMTNGGYNALMTDLNKTLKRLLSLASFGYSLNMCGVLNALLPEFSGGNKNLVSRATAGLLGILSSEKNINGIMDVANTAVNYLPKLELPGAAAKVFEGFKNPFDKDSSQSTSGLMDRVFGAATAFDDKWTNSDFDGISTISKMGKMNKEVAQSLQSSVKSSGIGGSSINSSILNSASISDEKAISVAYVAKCSCFKR